MGKIGLKFKTDINSQRIFLQNPAKYAAYIGGIGSGKTYAGAFWAIGQALQFPRSTGLIGANTYPQLRDSALPVLFYQLNEIYQIKHKYNKVDNIIYFHNGSKILCRSLENYNMLRGITIDWFWLDESRDTKKEAWDVITGRLRGQKVPFRQGRVTTTPNGFDWLYDEFVKKKDPDYFFIQAKTKENTYLPSDYIENLFGNYHDLLAQQELEGLFVNIYQGRVYYAFSRDLHIKDFDYDPMLPIHLSFDFNVNPMSCCVCQFHPSDNIVRVIDEIVIANSSTPEVMQEFNQRYGHHPREIFIYGDATGHSKGATTGTTDYQLIKQHLANKRAIFKVGKGNPAVKDRVNSVNSKLKNANNLIGIYIHSKCIKLIEDLERVTWKEGTMQIDKANQALTHISDAFGYFINAEFPIVPKRVERIGMNILFR